MKAYDKFNTLETKLTNLLFNNDLVHKFYGDRYPLVLVIRPEPDIEAQMAMMAAEDGGSSPDMSLALSLDADGLRMKINGRLIIDEDLMNKIKNLFKKLVTAYLFGAYAERFTKNGDDIRYSGKPDDEDAPPADTASDEDSDEPDEDDGGIPVDDTPDDAEDTVENADTDAEPDPFAEFFGDDAPTENADAE